MSFKIKRKTGSQNPANISHRPKLIIEVPLYKHFAQDKAGVAELGKCARLKLHELKASGLTDPTGSSLSIGKVAIPSPAS